MNRPRRLALAAGALAAVATLGLGLYGSLRVGGNMACAASAAASTRLGPLARGELAAFEATQRPEPAPPLSFTGEDGRALTMADFRGRYALVNLWATWCEPCKREMPALDRLEGGLGGPDFAVVAINVDTRNLDRPGAWLTEAGIVRLKRYSDPQARTWQSLRQAGQTEGLPITLLVGPDGCQIGRLRGWAEWASPDGLALLRAALGR